MNWYKKLKFSQQIDNAKIDQAVKTAGFKNRIEAAAYLQALNDNFDNILKYANYDAMEQVNPPYFIMIHSNLEGAGLGYLAFREFLKNSTPKGKFVSTEFTESGNAMFQKAQQEGLIKQLPYQANPYSGAKTLWQITGDAWAKPKQMISQLPEDIKNYLISMSF